MLKTLLKIFDYSWTMRCEQSTQWQPAGNSTNKRAVRNFPLQIWKCICKFSKVVFSTFDNSVREEQNKTSYRFLQIISTRNWPIQVISQFNTVGTVLVQNVPFKVVTESAVSVLIQIQNLGSKNNCFAIRNTYQCSERYISEIYLFSFRHKTSSQALSYARRLKSETTTDRPTRSQG